ncbi:hypothetical protein ACWDUL_20665 [Nocardia niigatensis]
MHRIRSIRPTKNFTGLTNFSIDDLPDLESVGLLASYLRHADNFDVTLQTLLRDKPGTGQRTGSKARNTLISKGYLVQVRFRHSYRGRYCTDVYRSADPHTDEDLKLLARRYAPGATIEITTRDSGGPVTREVTIHWAEITSRRGAETLVAATTSAAAPPHRTQPQPSTSPTGGGAENLLVAPSPAAPSLGRPEPDASQPYREKQEENQQEGSLPDTTPQPGLPPGHDEPACLEDASDEQRQVRREVDPGVFLRALRVGDRGWQPTDQVVSQHAPTVAALLARWKPKDLANHLVSECAGDGERSPVMGWLVKAIRGTPDSPPLTAAQRQHAAEVAHYQRLRAQNAAKEAQVVRTPTLARQNAMAVAAAAAASDTYRHVAPRPALRRHRYPGPRAPLSRSGGSAHQLHDRRGADAVAPGLSGPAVDGAHPATAA